MYLTYSLGISKLPNELIFVSKDNFSSLHLFWEPCLQNIFYVFEALLDEVKHLKYLLQRVSISKCSY